MGHNLLPPGQQWAAPGKWPQVGECLPRVDASPWQVTVAGAVEHPFTLSLDALRALPQVEVTTDIHCVTRWSKPAMHFTGVLLSSLLERAKVVPHARFVSFIARSERGHSTSLPLEDACQLGTLIALTADHKPLESAHGGPVRTIVPQRYFYKSLKWLERIELCTEDRPGFWESTAGYHNTGDPWREQRYIATAVSRQQARSILEDRSIAGLDLRGLDVQGHDLRGLQARRSLLRDARFGNCCLIDADFSGANLSNAQLTRADLRQANFQDADVEGADFSGADLRGADFSRASLCGASFCQFDGQGQPVHEAVFDQRTVFDGASLDALMPLQQVWLREAITRLHRA